MFLRIASCTAVFLISASLVGCGPSKTTASDGTATQSVTPAAPGQALVDSEKKAQGAADAANAAIGQQQQEVNDASGDGQ